MHETGRIVIASAGRDKDAYFVVTGESEGYVLLCDGKGRPFERPKRKNPRHIKPTDDSLPMEGIKTNRALRRALANYASVCREAAN